MIFDLYHNLIPKEALKIALRTAAVYNGATIDLHGYQGAMIVVGSGTLTDGVQTFKLQEGKDPIVKLSDLATIAATPEWSFWRKFAAAGAQSGPQIELRFVAPSCVDPDGAGHVDVTLMPMQNYDPVTTDWAKYVLTTTAISTVYYGSTIANVAKSQGAGGHTLGAVVAEIAAAFGAGDDTGNWTLERVRVELWEAGARTVNIDDITIAGVVYALSSPISNFRLGDSAGGATSTWDVVTTPHAGIYSVKLLAGTNAGSTYVDFNPYWSDVLAEDMLGTAPTLAAGDDDKLYWFGYIGHQRYIRVVDTVTAAGGQTGGILGAIAILGVPRHAPTALP